MASSQDCDDVLPSTAESFRVQVSGLQPYQQRSSDANSTTKFRTQRLFGEHW